MSIITTINNGLEDLRDLMADFKEWADGGHKHTPSHMQKFWQKHKVTIRGVSSSIAITAIATAALLSNPITAGIVAGVVIGVGVTMLAGYLLKKKITVIKTQQAEKDKIFPLHAALAALLTEDEIQKCKERNYAASLVPMPLQPCEREWQWWNPSSAFSWDSVIQIKQRMQGELKCLPYQQTHDDQGNPNAWFYADKYAQCLKAMVKIDNDESPIETIRISQEAVKRSGISTIHDDDHFAIIKDQRKINASFADFYRKVCHNENPYEDFINRFANKNQNNAFPAAIEMQLGAPQAQEHSINNDDKTRRSPRWIDGMGGDDDIIGAEVTFPTPDEINLPKAKALEDPVRSSIHCTDILAQKIDNIPEVKALSMDQKDGVALEEEIRFKSFEEPLLSGPEMLEQRKIEEEKPPLSGPEMLQRRLEDDDDNMLIERLKRIKDGTFDKSNVQSFKRLDVLKKMDEISEQFALDLDPVEYHTFFIETKHGRWTVTVTCLQGTNTTGFEDSITNVLAKIPVNDISVGDRIEWSVTEEPTLIKDSTGETIQLSLQMPQLVRKEEISAQLLPTKQEENNSTEEKISFEKIRDLPREEGQKIITLDLANKLNKHRDSIEMNFSQFNTFLVNLEKNEPSSQEQEILKNFTETDFCCYLWEQDATKLREEFLQYAEITNAVNTERMNTTRAKIREIEKNEKKRVIQQKSEEIKKRSGVWGLISHAFEKPLLAIADNLKDIETRLEVQKNLLEQQKERRELTRKMGQYEARQKTTETKKLNSIEETYSSEEERLKAAEKKRKQMEKEATELRNATNNVKRLNGIAGIDDTEEEIQKRIQKLKEEADNALEKAPPIKIDPNTLQANPEWRTLHQNLETQQTIKEFYENRVPLEMIRNVQARIKQLILTRKCKTETEAMHYLKQLDSFKELVIKKYNKDINTRESLLGDIVKKREEIKKFIFEKIANTSAKYDTKEEEKEALENLNFLKALVTKNYADNLNREEANELIEIIDKKLKEIKETPTKRNADRSNRIDSSEQLTKAALEEIEARRAKLETPLQKEFDADRKEIKAMLAELEIDAEREEENQARLKEMQARAEEIQAKVEKAERILGISPYSD